MAGRVKRENYVVIQGFMISEMKLKGNELLVYAIIYGFSQEEGQVFSGSLQYLAEWTNSSRQGVTKNLKSLVEKGYIAKNDKYINGVKFCEYYATKFNRVCNSVVQGMQQSCTPPIQQSCTNNIVLDNKDNNINNNKENNKKKYFENEELNNLFVEFLELRKKLKAVNSERAINSLLKTLSQYDDDTKYKMIENSVINSWKGVFPLKQEKTYIQQPIRKEIVPDWFNKDTKDTELTEAEESEAEDILASIDPDFLKRKEKLQEKLKNKYGKNASNREQNE